MQGLAQLLDLVAMPRTREVGSLNGEQDVVEEVFHEIIRLRHTAKHSRPQIRQRRVPPQ